MPTIILYFGSRRFHGSYGFFGKAAGFVECRKGAEWSVPYACVFTHSLTADQDPIDLRATVLDSYGRTLDPLENSTRPRCPLLGMADQVCHYRRVCPMWSWSESLTDCIIACLAHRCGLPSHIPTCQKSSPSSATLCQPGGSFPRSSCANKSSS